MAFETGTSSSLDDLLTKMVAFAVANAGFTEIAKVTGTGEQSDMYILQKGSIYWWFLGDSVAVTDYGTNGWLSMKMMNTTPTLGNRNTISFGQQYETRAQLWNRHDGPYTNYWFYSSASGNSVQVVVEVTPLVFTHWSFGLPEKFGTWTGGEFLTGSYLHWQGGWNGTTDEWTGSIQNYGNVPFPEGASSLSVNYGPSYVYYPQASAGNYLDWAAASNTIANNQRLKGAVPHEIPPNASLILNRLYEILLYCSPNAFNSRAALLPTYFQLYQQSSARFNMLGHHENVKVLNIDLIDPKSTIELDWDVYPIFQKGGDAAVANITGNIGLAYRRVL